MVECVRAIARVIFSALTYKFNAGDISFSIWGIVMTFNEFKRDEASFNEYKNKESKKV